MKFTIQIFTIIITETPSLQQYLLQNNDEIIIVSYVNNYQINSTIKALVKKK